MRSREALPAGAKGHSWGELAELRQKLHYLAHLISLGSDPQQFITMNVKQLPAY